MEPPVVSNEHKRVGLFAPVQVPDLVMPDGYKRSIATWFARLRGEQQTDRKEPGMPERFDQRGSAASRSEASTSRAARQLPVSRAPRTLVAAVSWLPAPASVGLEGNVGAIFRSYRRAGGLT
jgi:hypothetical protein